MPLGNSILFWCNTNVERCSFNGHSNWDFYKIKLFSELIVVYLLSWIKYEFLSMEPYFIKLFY